MSGARSGDGLVGLSPEPMESDQLQVGGVRTELALGGLAAGVENPPPNQKRRNAVDAGEGQSRPRQRLVGSSRPGTHPILPYALL